MSAVAGACGVAEDQHVGESLPGFVDGAGDRDPALGWFPVVLNAAS